LRWRLAFLDWREDMEAAKTFERDGKRYRPGDPLPDGLDAVTLAHYKRHGMVREPRAKTPGPA